MGPFVTHDAKSEYACRQLWICILGGEHDTKIADMEMTSYAKNIIFCPVIKRLQFKKHK